MPWIADDAESHTKKADTPAKKKKWAAVANKVLKETGDEAQVIKEANAAVSRNRNITPPGWAAGSTEVRFADIAPSSYDKKARTVEAVISLGSPVQRWYGTEKLRIASDAVALDRMKSSGIPLLDSHNQYGIDNALGRFSRIWFGSTSGKASLMGEIAFNDTERGRRAEGMVARGEIKGISAGYTVREWEITDKDGRVVDPEVERIRYDEEYTFTATRWELLEGSLVSVPADAPSMIRSMTFGSGEDRKLPRAGTERQDRLYRGKIVARNGTVTLNEDGSVTFEGDTVKIDGTRFEAPSSKNQNEAARARMQARQRMIDRMRE
jgi:phage head maturation protease